jgi:hypothetical protein
LGLILTLEVLSARKRVPKSFQLLGDCPDYIPEIGLMEITEESAIVQVPLVKYFTGTHYFQNGLSARRRS